MWDFGRKKHPGPFMCWFCALSSPRLISNMQIRFLRRCMTEQYESMKVWKCAEEIGGACHPRMRGMQMYLWLRAGYKSSSAEREGKKSSLEKERWTRREASADEMQIRYLSTIQIFEYCRVGQTKRRGRVKLVWKKRKACRGCCRRTRSIEEQFCSME